MKRADKKKREDKKKEKRPPKKVTRQVTQEYLDGLVANATARAVKDAKVEMIPQIKEGARVATSAAYLYMSGIAVEVLSKEYHWEFEELNKFAEQMFDTYNEGKPVEELIDILNNKAGMTVELDEEDKYWM